MDNIPLDFQVKNDETRQTEPFLIKPQSQQLNQLYKLFIISLIARRTSFHFNRT